MSPYCRRPAQRPPFRRRGRAARPAGRSRGGGHRGRARPSGGSSRVTGSATLGDIPLGTFSNALLPGTVGDDRGVDLGGIGSDIYPAGRKGEFWTVTDRGPNGQIKVDGDEAPHLPGARLRSGDREDPGVRRHREGAGRDPDHHLLGASPSRACPTRRGATRRRTPTTRRHRSRTTRTAWTPRASCGPTTAASGSWTSTGPRCPRLRAREGAHAVRAQGAGADRRGLPGGRGAAAVLLHRKINRGFEGLAQLPGGDLVLAVQSPLSLPDDGRGRGLAHDTPAALLAEKRAVTAEYAYRFDPVNVVDPSEDDTSELKISSRGRRRPRPAARRGAHRQARPAAASCTLTAWRGHPRGRVGRRHDVALAGAARRPGGLGRPGAAQAPGRRPRHGRRAFPGRSRASRAWTATRSRSSTTTTSG